MRIRVLPTTEGRCLLVIDRVQDVEPFREAVAAGDHSAVDGVVITEEEVELPQVDPS